MGLLLRVAVAFALVFVGWLAGSVYPAPAEVVAKIDSRAAALVARIDPETLDMERLRGLMSEEQYQRLRGEASELAARAGDLIVVSHDAGSLEEQQANLALDLAPAPAVLPETAETASALKLCPGMRITNAPPADVARQLTQYTPRVNVNGVALIVNPTTDACLSSAFGPRNGRLHKGLDYHADTGGPVVAAADGVVVEKLYRDDYGNMLLIDHGNGVFTRYAHLSTFGREIVVGSQVTAGQTIGLMGNTASYPIPIHLHYELLLGDYANPRGAFGLEPRSPFEFPAAS